MLSFAHLKKNLKKNTSALKKIKVAALADSASQLYVQALKGYAVECGFNLEVFEADYDQVDRQAFDTSSELFAFDPDYTLIFQCSQKLIKKFYKSSHKQNFAEQYLNYVQGLHDALSSLRARIIYFNFAEISDSIFGNYSAKVGSSFLYQLRKINFGLMDLSQKNKNLFINDLLSLQNTFGLRFMNDEKVYVNTDIVFSIDFLPHIAKNTLDIIQSLEGKFKKCLILDLDNITWGGIIGDDGMEGIQIGDMGIGKAFSELQLWIKQLKERGILLAVCSKNTESIAREPFEKHPDMILRPDDFAVFVANWETKVDNIRHIQSILNIGFDSMVFLDDNPFERMIVRTNIHGITVPELPEDPAEFLSCLRTLNLFETASFIQEDAQRTKQYQEQAGRVVLQRSFTNESDFLKSLDMVSEVKPFGAFNAPRISQLSQRSNQFNLRTVRYTEEDIQKLASSQKHFTLSFTLEDKFGDYGLISVIVLEKKDDKTFFIDTWLMSCRVLKRGIEYFTLKQIAEIARREGAEKITGEYIPTAKNEMVKNHYKDLGFSENNNLWELPLDDFKEKTTYIQIKEPVTS